MKRLVILLFLAAAAGGVYYYSSRSQTGPLVLTGIVTTEHVIVGPQVGGKIDQLLVKEGDEVHRDQLVALMVRDELQADRAYYANVVESVGSQVGETQAELRVEERANEDRIDQAQKNIDAAIAQQKEALAELESPRIALERSRKMLEQGVGTQQDADQTRTAYESAKARVEIAEKQVEVQRAALALARSNAEQIAVQQNRVRTVQEQREAATAQRQKADVRLAYSEIHAPIDGIVDVRAAREGEVVNPGQAIVTLVNPDDLWVRADVEETYIDRIRLGDQLKVRLPSGDERMGTVFYRATDGNFATQRDVSRTKRDVKAFEIRLRVDNTDRRLAVGMTTYVELPVF